MSDFVDGFWTYYISVIALLGIVWCVWLLFSQRKWLKAQPRQVEDTGHVWDGDLRELNNSVPRWWSTMYLLMCLFGLGYLVLYPGLGAYRGLLGYSSAQELRQDQFALQSQVKPLYAKYDGLAVDVIAKDPEAQVIGQKLFLNFCAQCHGSDAKGATSFPNLIEGVSLHGRSPESIAQTINQGRNGIMPAFKETLSPAMASDIAQYVRSLSGLAHDQIRVIAGKREYMNYCVACHGAQGEGNQALGAPNLTDGVWLYGSGEATIVQGILNGRNNLMPAQAGLLTPEQIKMLTAWVWGQTHGQDILPPAAVTSKR
jgi:cytochrome c oxidase cbb3-type subunit 3